MYIIYASLLVLSVAPSHHMMDGTEQFMLTANPKLFNIYQSYSRSGTDLVMTLQSHVLL